MVKRFGASLLLCGLAVLSPCRPSLAVDPDPFEMHAVADIPGEHVRAYKVARDGTSPETVLLDDAVLLDHTAVAKASLEHDDQGQPSILIKLTSKGGDHFAEITTKYLDKRIGIVLNGQLCSAPVVKSPMFGGSLRISGNFSENEVAELVKKINGIVSP